MRPETPIKAFPIAELLVQNGAEIPATLPSIPLSAASRLYIEQRTASKREISSSIAASGSALGSSADGATDVIGRGDILGPLPSRGLSERDRDRGEGGGAAKLHKRGSAGARFAGKVARELERGFSGS